NVTGSGPTWLFDIDTLTKTMNYQPITIGNQSNPSAGVQKQFDAEKVGEENVQQYVLFPVWSSDFEEFSDNSTNEVNAADSQVPVVGQISTNNTHTFSAAGPSNADEEVNVYQPLRFEDPDHPEKVYKVVKELYGLHQAPRA
nr:ribonuclease H-like domain, reverse transcriptase, RNA-dependent DNA polymerase [Tanacetum cinerariifolium]